MPMQPFNIPGFVTGEEKDLPSYQIPDDATDSSSNIYYWRNRVKRRNGNTLIGRITEIATNTILNAVPVGSVTFSSTLSLAPVDPYSITITITDTAVGVVYTFTDDGAGNLSAGAGTSGTINYTTGAYTLNYPALPATAGQYDIAESWESYPGRACMGILNPQTINVSNENTLVFDTRVVNFYNKTTSSFDDVTYTTAGTHFNFSGSDHDFFWGWDYYNQNDGGGTNRNLFWVTNNVITDGIAYWNGQPVDGWVRLVAAAGPTIGTAISTKAQTPIATPPAPDPNWFVFTCKLIVSYRDRLVMLNTTEWENGSQKLRSNRVRWSQNGTPLTQGALADTTAWVDNVPGKGGYLDAPTTEAIISCQFYKDTLIVFFEKSTWQLYYTSNSVLPFAWKRINTEFGCESMKSAIGFDDGILAIGDKAIISASSTNVDRIDLKIPDEIFNFNNENNGVERVAGIRDFRNELIFWTIPSKQSKTFPNQILVFNYRQNAYSLFDDSITAFGYIQFTTRKYRWKDLHYKWKDFHEKWNSGVKKALFPNICAGNQQGFIFVFSDERINDDNSLYLTNITVAINAVITCPNHNLLFDEYVLISSVEGMTGINDKVGRVKEIIDKDNFSIDIDSSGFTPYTSNGFIRSVKSFRFRTKKYNPWYQEGKRLRVDSIDCYVDEDKSGEISMNLYIDDNSSQAINETDGDVPFVIDLSKDYGPTISNQKIWVRIYTGTIAQFIQAEFFLSESQIRNKTYGLVTSQGSSFMLYSLTLWLEKMQRLYDSFNLLN